MAGFSFLRHVSREAEGRGITGFVHAGSRELTDSQRFVAYAVLNKTSLPTSNSTSAAQPYPERQSSEENAATNAEARFDPALPLHTEPLT